jgi:hypothetical protein
MLKDTVEKFVSLYCCCWSDIFSVASFLI